MEVYPRSRVFLARTLRLVYAHACLRGGLDRFEVSLYTTVRVSQVYGLMKGDSGAPNRLKRSTATSPYG